ncbi:MAG TPA: hypothetical protein VHE09_14925 [Rhizomicrobium sp.]|jgi:hypothetical protein|nr:hypothetical protein [Rhizomicrobium sp.]
MPQINFHTTEEFERDLLVVMAAMNLSAKSKAIRCAVQLVAQAHRACDARRTPDRDSATAAAAGS